MYSFWKRTKSTADCAGRLAAAFTNRHNNLMAKQSQRITVPAHTSALVPKRSRIEATSRLMRALPWRHNRLV
jgi:hypothetical protein